MAYGWGSLRSTMWAILCLAAATVAWSAWRVVDVVTSDAVIAPIEPRSGTPPTPLFGGELAVGNRIDLTVDKADLGRLGGFVEFCRIVEPLAAMTVILAGMYFAYRFSAEVIRGTPFSKFASINLIGLAVSVVAYPVIPSIFGLLGTNSVIGALDLDDFDAHSSAVGYFVAIGIASFIQFVYVLTRQGAKLAEDTDGLV
ncbi:hypothetical protein ABH922_002653 [Rhodococcus sp. 27YEA15]|uniref:hypothetical protein n=1 Tax=Rhodococcus sp. 27YEA15 TaxID=3156259 RepID=UPI003C79F9A7